MLQGCIEGWGEKGRERAAFEVTWMVRGIKRLQLNNSILHSTTFWYFVGPLFGIVFQGLIAQGWDVKRPHLRNALITTLEGLNFLPLYGLSF